jgi:hypothetical protein
VELRVIVKYKMSVLFAKRRLGADELLILKECGYLHAGSIDTLITGGKTLGIALSINGMVRRLYFTSGDE